MDGWIKLYRKLLDDVVWVKSSNEQRVILITLLLLANHRENEWEWQGQKFNIMPGQLVTSAESIINKCEKSITRQNVRSALKKFEKLNFLTHKTTKTGTLITINNWAKYQSDNVNTNQVTNQEVTNNQPRGNQEVTTNKNDKNNKNNNNNKNIPLKKEPKIFTEDDKEYLLAEYLSKQISERLNKPLKEEKDLQKWSAEFEKMVRLDKLDINEIKEVLMFSQKNQFWQSNILSASKFRKQYLTLLSQKINKVKKGGEDVGKYGNNIQFIVPKTETNTGTTNLDEEIRELGLI